MSTTLTQKKGMAEAQGSTQSVGDQVMLVNCQKGQPMFPPGCDNDGNVGNPQLPYRLQGVQVEPEAGWWGTPVLERELPRVVSLDEVRLLVENPVSPFYVPPYPRGKAFLDWEIAELVELAALRDDPAQISGSYTTTAPPANSLPKEFTDTTRAPVSDFIQLDPPPFGAIFNIGSRTQYAISDINQQHLRRQLFQNGTLPPVVTTGRQLARMFEAETPGLLHRHALNSLFYKRPDISPPRQARVWMALDIAIYSALLAAWHYKWAAPQSHSYRQRPNEYYQQPDFRVLFDDVVDDCGLRNKCARTNPCPSPGTPRHPAYPSGHSTFSAAASEVLSYFFPEERAQFERLANNIGTARLWGGVHWRTDHAAGQRIGKAVAYLLTRQLQGDCIAGITDVVVDAPAQETLAQQAMTRRTQEECIPPDHDLLPTQRDTPFNDCEPQTVALF